MGRPCVALLPIGAYLPRWFMARMHMSPSDAVRAHDVLGAESSVAMHFGTFELADEGIYEAPGELDLALREGHHAPFIAPRVGEQRSFRCTPRSLEPEARSP
jgi:L-ascorbate metabolism protein UlaG (beta-lactamase superfamily)